MCDPYTGQGCLAGKECLSSLSANPEVGLCTPPPPACDVYTQDCPAGLTCLPYSRLWGGFDFRCLTAGENAVGEPCGGSAGGCGRGLICIRRSSDGTASCREICQTDEDCTLPQTACVGVSNTYQVHYCREP